MRRASSTNKAPDIFISYRRSESSGYSGRIYDRLRAALPEAEVFIDTERIAPGEDWRARLAERIRSSDVVLVLVGDEWRTLADASGRRRLDDPQDVTRWEIESALAQGKHIVPVLLDDAQPLKADELPSSLRPLAALQAVRVRHDAFDATLDDLIARLTGRRLRDEAEAAQGNLRLESARRWIVPAIALAIVLLAWMRLFDLFALDTRIATWTLALADAVAPLPLDPRIVPVAIDAQQDARDPAMRARYAAAIVALARAGASRIVLDMHFHEARAGDNALAAAMQEARKLGAEVFFGFVDVHAGKPRAVAPLAAAATGVGLACAGRRLGYAVSIPLAFDLRAEGAGWRAHPAPALSLLGAAGSARIAAADLDTRTLAIERDGRIATHPFGMASGVVSAGQACAAIEPQTRVAELLLRVSDTAEMRGRRIELDRVLAEAGTTPSAKGAIVVIGFETPEETFRIARGLERQARFGYELQADAINTLLQGRITQFAGPGLQALAAVIFATLGAAIGVRSRNFGRARAAALLTVAALAYAVLALALAAAEDLLLNTAYDVSAFAFAYALFRALSRRWLK